MRKSIVVVLVLVVAVFSFGFRGQKRNLRSYHDATKYEVSDQQIENLIFMYQEEKLARDVYLELADKWNLRVFSNIARSEQQHMDSVKLMLEKYNVNFSVDNRNGEFSSEEFTKLYNELIQRGNSSISEAVKVGIDIEQLDIKDLKERLEGATPDIEVLYQNLIRGSENHLSAFKRNL